MQRRLLPLSSVLCLFFCGAILALWVRSYRNIDYVLWKTSTRRNSIGSAYGRIVLKSFHGYSEGQPGVKTMLTDVPTWSAYIGRTWPPGMGPPPDSNVLGFAWVKSNTVEIYDHHIYVRIGAVPDWFLLALFLSVPFVSAIRRSRRRKSEPEGA